MTVFIGGRAEDKGKLNSKNMENNNLTKIIDLFMYQDRQGQGVQFTNESFL